MKQRKGEHKIKPADDYPEEFRDEATRNKIDRHLRDINDTISEDDIKNVITDISSSNGKKTDEETSLEQEPLSNSKTAEDNTQNQEQAPTTWNLLD